MTVQLFCGDCLDILPTLEAWSVDAAITDPPFFVTITSQSKRTPSFEFLKQAEWRAAFGWIAQVERLLIDGGTLYAFTNDEDIAMFKRAISEVGMRVYQRLHWIKTNPLPSYTKHNYRGGVELAFYCCKGKKPAYFAERTQQELYSYWMMPIVGGKKRTKHPTQKPIALMKEWITNSCPPGGTVFDPFMGSSTTGVACVQTGRNFIGIEIDPGYFEIAKARIESAQQEMIQGVLANA